MPYVEFEGRTRAVGPGVLTIGNGREAAWRIDGCGLSALHALIAVEHDGRLIVRRVDPGASILLNGETLTNGVASLAPGDELRMSEAVFTIRAVSSQHGEGGKAYLRDVRRDRYYVLAEQTEIGRELRCPVLLLEPEVSRLHAEVRREGEGYLLCPRSGVTLHNGTRVTSPTPLGEGDDITIGQTLLRYSTTVPTRAQPAPSRPVAPRRRASEMQTTYQGAVEARERIDRRSRHRVAAIVGGVLAACVVLALAISTYRTWKEAERVLQPPPAAAPAPAPALPDLADSADSADAAIDYGVPPDTVAQLSRPRERPLVRQPIPLEEEPVSDQPITVATPKRPRP
jgi:predicted component of type VI protein secretion system